MCAIVAYVVLAAHNECCVNILYLWFPYGWQSMRGNKVVVEMKNDTEISGVLEETDRNMK